MAADRSNQTQDVLNDMELQHGGLQTHPEDVEEAHNPAGIKLQSEPNPPYQVPSSSDLMNDNNDSDKDVIMEDQQTDDESSPSSSDYAPTSSNKRSKTTQNKHTMTITAHTKWRIARKNEKLHELKTDKTKLKKDIADLKKTIFSLRQRRDEQDRNIFAMTNERIDILNHNVFVLDDNDVADRLEAIFQHSKRWAKLYGLQTAAGIKEDTRNDIECLLDQDIGAIVKFASKQAIAAVTMKILPPSIVLNSLVNRFIVAHILVSPMRCLYRLIPNDNFEVDMNKLMDIAECNHMNNTYRLQSSIIREVDPPDEVKTSDFCKEKAAEIAEVKCKEAMELSVQCVASIDPLLDLADDETRKKCRDDLQSLFLDVIRLASRLGAQNPFIKYHFRGDLSKNRFAKDHHRMKGHPALKLDDGIDAEGNGTDWSKLHHAPDLVVEPEIVICGDRNGQDYSESTKRQLKKAVVFMLPR